MASNRETARYGQDTTSAGATTYDTTRYGSDTRSSGMAGGFRRVSWGAILGGVVILLIVHLVLGLLGLGVGLSTVEPATEGVPDAANAGIAGGAWYAVVAVIAAFAGGWVAARLAGVPMRTDGILHGLLTWATATLILLYVVTSSLGALIGGSVSMVGGAIQTITQQAGSAAGGLTSVLPEDIRQQAEDLLRQGGQQAQQAGQETQQQAQQTTGTASPVGAAQRLVRGVREGASPQDRQAAIDFIAQRAGIPPQEAEQRLSQFQTTYRDTMAQTQAQATQAAETAAEGLSATALAAVVAMVLAAVAALIGGAVGSPRRNTTA